MFLLAYSAGVGEATFFINSREPAGVSNKLKN